MTWRTKDPLPDTMIKGLITVLLALFALQQSADASEDRKLVPMTDQGASTFYVDVFLKGIGLTEFLVDTGSSYMTINEETLETLKQEDQATYVKDLKGVLADGSEQVVPVYRIKAMRIGESCGLTDVKAAVFPGRTRNILGLSALRAAAPFVFSVEPPTLELSNCVDEATVVAELGDDKNNPGATP